MWLEVGYHVFQSASPVPGRLLLLLLPGSSFLAHCPLSQGAHGYSSWAVPQLSPVFVCPRGWTWHFSWLCFRRSWSAHACPGLSGWQPCPQVHGQVSPVWHHPQTGWDCSLPPPQVRHKDVKWDQSGINPCSTSLVTSLQFIFMSCDINHHQGLSGSSFSLLSWFRYFLKCCRLILRNGQEQCEQCGVGAPF